MKYKGIYTIQGVENQSVWEKAQLLFNELKLYVGQKLKLKDETAMKTEQESRGSNVV